MPREWGSELFAFRSGRNAGRADLPLAAQPVEVVLDSHPVDDLRFALVGVIAQLPPVARVQISPGRIPPSTRSPRRARTSPRSAVNTRGRQMRLIPLDLLVGCSEKIVIACEDQKRSRVKGSRALAARLRKRSAESSYSVALPNRTPLEISATVHFRDGGARQVSRPRFGGSSTRAATGPRRNLPAHRIWPRGRVDRVTAFRPRRARPPRREGECVC